MADPDPLADLLRKAPLSDAQRADLWDTYHRAATPEDLATALQPLKLPNPVKADLWDLKAGRPGPTTAPAPAAPVSAPPLTAIDAAGLGDYAVGAAKGLGQTFISLGNLVHQIPGVTRAVDALYGVPGISRQAFTEAQQAVQPTTTAQHVGKIGEQIAETILPGRLISSAGEKAVALLAPKLAPLVGETAAKLLPRAGVEALGGAGLAAAQGGDPRVGAALGAVLPTAGAAVQELAPGLKATAAQKVMQALGPTKERYKAIAERLTPEILRRGLGGSREALQAQAADTLASVGSELDQALTQTGGQTAGVQPVIDALEHAKDAFRTTVSRPTGPTTVVFEPRSVQQLDSLQDILRQLGPDATVAQLVAVRRAWDKVVAQAGGYAQRAGGAIGVPLAEQTEAWAKREGASAIREHLNATVPDLGAINKEWSFWKNLDDVLSQTLKRTQPQGVGLGRMIAEGAGGVAGASLGAPAGVVPALGTGWALGKAIGMARAVMTSPRWRFVSAHLRDDLADAIMSNQVPRITAALGRISASQGAQLAANPTP